MERKHFDIKRDSDWIVASTPDVDRDRDRVMPLGLNLDNYRKNPVLFYGHSYAEPWSLIGTAAELEQDSTGLRIRVVLREPAHDTDPMHIVKALWDGGLLKAASIGFQPLEAQPNEKGGRDIHRAELMEISLVPIPANQNALRLAAKAMDGGENAPAYIEIPPTDDDTSPYMATTTNTSQLLWRSQGGSITTTQGGTLTIQQLTFPASKEIEDGKTKEAAEATAEATGASGGGGDAPGTGPQGEAEAAEEAVLKADEDGMSAADSAEVQAVIDGRIAAILADFVESVRPYLVQS